MYNDSYDYDDLMDTSNPLMTQENLELMRICNSISEGTAYEEFGLDPNGWHEREAEDRLDYKPGLHTRSFSGNSKAVELQLDKFNKKMQEKYDTYEVKEIAPVQLANGTCMYLMFKV